MSRRLEMPRGLWLAGAFVLSSGGCGQEFVIGVLGVSSTGSGSGMTTTMTTLAESSTTADGTTQGNDASASGTSGSTGSTGSTTEPPVPCEAPPEHLPCDSDSSVFHAMGLGCPGEPEQVNAILDEELTSPEANAFWVIEEYGNPTWVPSEGESFLLLTTGILPAPDAAGYMQIPPGVTDQVPGNNGNPDGASLPEPIVPAPGSQGGAGGRPYVDCDGLGDCSDSLPGPWQAAGPANDLIYLTFDAEVPPGTPGYEVDLAWFSAEFATRAMSAGTDVAVWWQSSEAFTGNVATLDGQALAVSELAAWLASQGLMGDDPALAGTGHEGFTGAPCDYPGGSYPDCPRGAGTGWMTLRAPVVPGETVSIAVAVFDLGDNQRDTSIALDNWRWSCQGCTLGADCGLTP